MYIVVSCDGFPANAVNRTVKRHAALGEVRR